MLKQLGIDQVDVFGVSWGGALAQEFALRYPSMVRRLIFAATSAGPAMLVKPADILDFFWQEQKRQTAQARLAQFDTDAAALRCGERHAHGQPANLLPPAHRLGWLDQPAAADLLRQRTLILTGERDTLVRLYNAHILRRTIRRAELHVPQGEGHFFVVTSARRTAEAIREFLCQQHGDEVPAPMIANGMFKPRLLQSERN